MRIVAQTNLSHEGSACWIDEEVTLCEAFNKYFVTHSRIVVGHDCDQHYATDLSDYETAFNYYIHIGGEHVETLDR